MARYKTRRNQSTISSRTEEYEATAEESINWVAMTNEQLAVVATKEMASSVDTTLKTKEQLLRLVFLARMKKMIA